MRRTEPVSRPRSDRRAFALVLAIVLCTVAVLLSIVLRRGTVRSTGALRRLPSITIPEIDGHKTLIVDGVVLGDTGFTSKTQAGLRAHLPLLLHVGPRNVLQIGFGTGDTTRAICRHQVDRLDCVEPIFPLLEVPGQFSRGGPKVLDDGRVHVHTAEPRDFVRDGKQAYDVIISCPAHPVLARDGSLYTVEFFRDCAKRLKPGGIFSTSIATRDIRFDDVAVVVRSLRKAFPFVYVWQSPLGRNTEVIVVALTRPTHPGAPIYAPYDALADRMRGPALADYLDNPVDLMGLYILGPQEVNALAAASTQLNTDANAYIETVAVPALDAYALDEYASEKLAARTYAELLDERAGGGVFFDLRELGDERGGQVVNRLAHRWWSSNRALRGRLYELAGEPHRARAEWHRALRDDPTNEIARGLLGMTYRAFEEARALADPVESSFRIGLYHVAHAEEALTPDKRTAQLEEAIAAFERALEHNAQYADAYDHLARTYLALDRLDDAIDTTVRMRDNALCPASETFIRDFRGYVHGTRRINAGPDDPLAWRAFGAGAERIELDDLAVEAHERALAMAPVIAAEVEKELAALEVLRGNFREAAEHAEQAGDQELVEEISSWQEHPIRPVAQRAAEANEPSPPRPSTPEEQAQWHWDRGQALMNILDYDGARKGFERSMGLSPAASDSLAIGMLAEATRDYEAGLEALDRLEAGSPSVGKHGVFVLVRLRLDALRAVQHDGDRPTPEHLSELAFTYDASDLLEEALRCRLSAVKMKLDDPAFLVNLLLHIARYYEDTWQPEKRAECLKQAQAAVEAAGDTFSAEETVAIGAAYFAAGSYSDDQALYAEGIRYLLKAEQMDPENVGILIEIGGIYRETLGYEKKAIEYFRKALAIDPGNDEARALLETTQRDQDTLQEQ